MFTSREKLSVQFITPVVKVQVLPHQRTTVSTAVSSKCSKHTNLALPTYHTSNMKMLVHTSARALRSIKCAVMSYKHFSCIS